MLSLDGDPLKASQEDRPFGIEASESNNAVARMETTHD
jgi:hypothetical protein